MNELKSTKYMNLFTTIGFIVGFTIIILYAMMAWSYLYLFLGLAVIFLCRFLGYGLDRLSEKKMK